jgi:hypothetical protein
VPSLANKQDSKWEDLQLQSLRVSDIANIELKAFCSLQKWTRAVLPPVSKNRGAEK